MKFIRQQSFVENYLLRIFQVRYDLVANRKILLSSMRYFFNV